MPTQYLFIDGNWFENCAKDVCRDWFGVEPNIDYVKLGRGFTKVFYYDSLPAKLAGESPADYDARRHSKLQHFDGLRALNGWHVPEGHSKAGRRPGTTEQKEVDVLIAVDMLTHAHRKNMDALTFLSGDRDFRPLVEALVANGMYVTLWYYPKSTSNDLRFAADGKLALDLFWFHKMMTEQFRSAHPIPLRQISGQEQQPKASFVESGRIDGEVVAWFKKSLDDQNHFICSTVASNQFVQLSFQGDPVFLKRVYDAHYGAVTWTKV